MENGMANFCRFFVLINHFLISFVFQSFRIQAQGGEWLRLSYARAAAAVRLCKWTKG